MTQFPKDLRQWLGDNCVISLPTLITESIALMERLVKY